MSAERQIPGGPFVNETGSNEQQIPGGPFINETVSAAGTTVTTGLGALSLAGLAPTLAQTWSATTGLGALTLAGLAPTIAVSAADTIQIGLGDLQITGRQPTLAQTWSASPEAGEITLDGLAPSLLPITYDYLHAASDVDTGTWAKSSDDMSSDLYTMVDEDVIDDNDYIYTSTLDDECEIGLEVGSAPSISGYMHLQIKIPPGFSPVGTLTVTLMDGVAQVQQWADQSVSAGDLLELEVTETVSNYDDLRVRLKATA